eukprot:1183841-Prorocentrum_minimum.AAC.4
MDVKGYYVDVKDCYVDVKGYYADVKGYLVRAGVLGVASEAAFKFVKVQSHCKPVQTLMDSFQ